MISDDNSDENEALEFGSDDYGSDGSQDEEDVSYFESYELIYAIVSARCYLVLYDICSIKYDINLWDI